MFIRKFRDVKRIGPVQVGTRREARGIVRHTAVCTAKDCGWSATYEFDQRPAAELAARTHRCKTR
ncbi:mobile element transfer protein [Streptomyces sp. SID3343]|uniref:mobile element transfer protein n=1 Tax=Streptomyces sp. SID3343 TaxID=2690260 RepID=UPI0013711478|nr:Mobile element transfer [Streptomyces sp. SID3343]